MDSRRNYADSDSNDGHLGVRSDREWRRQYGPAIGAEVVQRLPCGWRRGSRSLRLRTQLCFDRGNVFQYWRTELEEACKTTVTVSRSPWYSRKSTVPGLRRGRQELAAGTLTPLILVRIQVPQPVIKCLSGEPIVFDLTGFPNLAFNTIWAEMVSFVISAAAVTAPFGVFRGLPNCQPVAAGPLNGPSRPTVSMLSRDIGDEVAKLCSGKPIAQGGRSSRRVRLDGLDGRFRQG